MIEAATIWRRDYIAPDGGGKLETTDERDGFIEGSRITKNENSQLFLVMGHIALHKLGLLTSEDKDTFIRHIENSRFDSGIFLRRQADTGIRQSHDNILAICVGSVIHNTGHAQEICGHGEQTGFNYSFRGWEIECQLQGGDIALVKVMAGRTPTLIEMLWGCVGMALKKDAGQVNLATVRMYGLNLIDHPSIIVKIYRGLMNLCFMRHSGKVVESVEQYFKRDGEHNPFIDLWREAFK